MAETTPPRILIIHGGWEGHEPGPCSELMREELLASGCAVELRDRLDCLNDTALLGGCACVVMNWTMGTISGEQIGNLQRVCRAGCGLAGWHGGMGDAFHDCCLWQYMVGGQFVAHPGNHIDYRVSLLGDHPIVAGLEDFDLHSEQYYLHCDPSNTVLATTTFTGAHDAWIDGCVMPTVWTRRYGQGRVFYSALGHNAADFAVPQVREICRRGLLWAAKA
jgi:type 1 glutamine amidotransferase